MVHVAFVPPRYGADIIGGAENGARGLAEALVRSGHRAEVFTSCASDIETWADAYPPGTSEHAGVSIHRFLSTGGRDKNFGRWGVPMITAPSGQPDDVIDEWLVRQGPHNPDMVEAALASQADVIVGYPYLYWPAVEAARRAPERTIWHPAAHDEPTLRFPLFGSMMRSLAGLVWHSDAERRMVEGYHHTGGVPQIVLGLGVEPGEGDVGAAARRVGVEGRPYLLCVGRLDPGKGTTALVEMFAAYKERTPSDLALVLVGPSAFPVRSHPDVVVAGVVDEAAKWGLLAGAELLVSPSGNESFSLVLLEAFLAGTPAMVNARCGPTTEHALASKGAVPYDSYAGFEVTLDLLLADPQLRSQLGRSGKSYVEATYLWDAVVDRYVRFLTSIV